MWSEWRADREKAKRDFKILLRAKNLAGQRAQTARATMIDDDASSVEDARDGVHDDEMTMKPTMTGAAIYICSMLLLIE